MDDTTIQNALDASGFAGLALGVVFGLVLGVWIVVKVWRFAVRELRESLRADGLGEKGEGET